MKNISIIIFMLFLCSCSFKTTITDPKGETWTIKSKHDSVVEYVAKDITIKVDNTGGPSLFEQFIVGVFKATEDTNVQVGGDND